MSANGQPCETCGALAQVEESHADGSLSYYCVPHAIGAFEAETKVFAEQGDIPINVQNQVADSIPSQVAATEPPVDPAIAVATAQAALDAAIAVQATALTNAANITATTPSDPLNPNA